MIKTNSKFKIISLSFLFLFTQGYSKPIEENFSKEIPLPDPFYRDISRSKLIEKLTSNIDDSIAIAELLYKPNKKGKEVKWNYYAREYLQNRSNYKISKIKLFEQEGFGILVDYSSEIIDPNDHYIDLGKRNNSDELALPKLDKRRLLSFNQNGNRQDLAINSINDGYLFDLGRDGATEGITQNAFTLYDSSKINVLSVFPVAKSKTIYWSITYNPYNYGYKLTSEGQLLFFSTSSSSDSVKFNWNNEKLQFKAVSDLPLGLVPINAEEINILYSGCSDRDISLESIVQNSYVKLDSYFQETQGEDVYGQSDDSYDPQAELNEYISRLPSSLEGQNDSVIYNSIAGIIKIQSYRFAASEDKTILINSYDWDSPQKTALNIADLFRDHSSKAMMEFYSISEKKYDDKLSITISKIDHNNRKANDDIENPNLIKTQLEINEDIAFIAQNKIGFDSLTNQPTNSLKVYVLGKEFADFLKQTVFELNQIRTRNNPLYHGKINLSRHYRYNGFDGFITKIILGNDTLIHSEIDPSKIKNTINKDEKWRKSNFVTASVALLNDHLDQIENNPNLVIPLTDKEAALYIVKNLDPNLFPLWTKDAIHTLKQLDTDNYNQARSKIKKAIMVEDENAIDKLLKQITTAQRFAYDNYAQNKEAVQNDSTRAYHRELQKEYYYFMNGLSPMLNRHSLLKDLQQTDHIPSLEELIKTSIENPEKLNWVYKELYKRETKDISKFYLALYKNEKNDLIKVRYLCQLARIDSSSFMTQANKINKSSDLFFNVFQCLKPNPKWDPITEKNIKAFVDFIVEKNLILNNTYLAKIVRDSTWFPLNYLKHKIGMKLDSLEKELKNDTNSNHHNSEWQFSQLLKLEESWYQGRLIKKLKNSANQTVIFNKSEMDVLTDLFQSYPEKYDSLFSVFLPNYIESFDDKKHIPWELKNLALIFQSKELAEYLLPELENDFRNWIIFQIVNESNLMQKIKILIAAPNERQSITYLVQKIWPQLSKDQQASINSYINEFQLNPIEEILSDTRWRGFYFD